MVDIEQRREVKEILELVRKIPDAEYRQDKSGRYQIYYKGEFVVGVASTPDGPFRRIPINRMIRAGMIKGDPKIIGRKAALGLTNGKQKRKEVTVASLAPADQARNEVLLAQINDAVHKLGGVRATFVRRGIAAAEKANLEPRPKNFASADMTLHSWTRGKSHGPSADMIPFWELALKSYRDHTLDEPGKERKEPVEKKTPLVSVPPAKETKVEPKKKKEPEVGVEPFTEEKIRTVVETRTVEVFRAPANAPTLALRTLAEMLRNPPVTNEKIDRCVALAESILLQELRELEREKS